MSKKIDRRKFLRMTAASAAGLFLASCAPASATPQTVKEVVTVVVEKAGEKVIETQVVEKVVTATPELAPAVKAEPTPLLYWFQAENHKPEYDRRQKELEDKFNIKITYELLGRDAMTKKFPTVLMAGSGYPDIIEQNAEDIVKFLKGDDKVIPFVAIDDFLSASPYATDVLENRWARYTKGGKKYGAPHDVHPIIMIYNDTEWKKFGVDMAAVKTYDEYLAAMGKMEKKLPDGSPRIGIMDCLGCAVFGSMMLQKGVWWTDANEEPMLTNPAFKEAVETWYKFKSYWVDIDWGNAVAMMKKGQVMTQFIPDWFFGIYKQGLKDDAEFGKTSGLRVMRIPYFKPDDCRTGSWGGTAASVPKLSKIVDLAMKVLLYTYFENGEKQLEARFNDTGILPPVKSVWDADIFKQPEGFLGGTNAGQVFIEAARQLPKYSENWKTALVASAWGEQQALAWADTIKIDQAIQTADENAKAEIKKNE